MLRSRTYPLISIVLIVALGSMPCLAKTQVVATQDLHQAIVESSKERQEKVERVQKFFSSEPVRQALSTADINFQQVQEAVPFLTARELSQLEAQIDQVEQKIVGGALNNQEITYILIALATAVIILVIVAA